MGIPFWVPSQRRQRHNCCLCGFEFFLHIFTKSSSASVCPDISVGTIAITIIVTVSNITIIIISSATSSKWFQQNHFVHHHNIMISTIITIIFCWEWCPPPPRGRFSGQGGRVSPAPRSFSWRGPPRRGAGLLNTDYGRPGTLFHWENPDTWIKDYFSPLPTKLVNLEFRSDPKNWIFLRKSHCRTPVLNPSFFTAFSLTLI